MSLGVDSYLAIKTSRFFIAKLNGITHIQNNIITYKQLINYHLVYVIQ